MNWLQATRAVAHATVAALITFTQAHNSLLGLNSLVLFGALYLAASVGTHFIDRRNKLTSARLATPLIVPVLVAIAATIALTAGWNPLQSFRWLTAVLAAGLLVSEAWLVRKAGLNPADRRDAVISGFLSLALLGLFAGFNMGQVPLVGFLGAFHAILAVHLGIAATSPKPKK
jgi:asparagine N-glycosylation enzyme membrane subunit Stt3